MIKRIYKVNLNMLKIHAKSDNQSP